MSAKKRLSKYVPSVLVQNIRKFCDSRSLSKVAILSFESKTLADVLESEIRTIFRRPEIDEEWAKVSETVERFQLPDGTGGVNSGDRRAIYYLIYGMASSRVLEVGTHIGASTVHIALAHKSLREKKEQLNQKLVSVDIADVNDNRTLRWKSFGAKQSPLEMIRDINAANFVEFKVSSAEKYLDTTSEKYDFIFLDGDHSAKAVYIEISKALNILNPGGVILLHDYFPRYKPLWKGSSSIPGPYMAVQRILTEGWGIVVTPLGELPWETKSGSTATSLALLTKE